MAEKRRTSQGNGTILWSEELTFIAASNPCERYSFLLRAAIEGPTGSIGLFFAPRRSPNHEQLSWPMTTTIELKALRNTETDPVASQRRYDDHRDFFANHAPPQENNKNRVGWKNFLSTEMVDSGDFFFGDALVFMCSQSVPQ